MSAHDEGVHEFWKMTDAEAKSARGFYDARDSDKVLVEGELSRMLQKASDMLTYPAKHVPAEREALADALLTFAVTGMLTAAEPCPGIEVSPGVYSGCNAAETGAKDCPECGYPACVWDAVEAAAAAFPGTGVVPWSSPEEETEFKQYLADLVWERVTRVGMTEPELDATDPRDPGDRAATQQLHIAGVMWTRRPEDDSWTTDSGDVLHDIDYLVQVAKEGRQDRITRDSSNIPGGSRFDPGADQVLSRSPEVSASIEREGDLRTAIFDADRLRRDHNGIMTVSIHLGHDGDNTVLLRAYDTPDGPVVLGKGCSGASLRDAVEEAEKDWRERALRGRMDEILADAVKRFGIDPHAPEDNAPIFNTAGFEIAAFALGWGVKTAEAVELLSTHPRVVRLAGGAHWYLLPRGICRAFMSELPPDDGGFVSAGGWVTDLAEKGVMP